MKWVFLIAFLFISCSSQMSKTNDFELFYEKMSCRGGKCPILTLNIQPSGFALLDAKENLEIIGLFETLASQDKIEELFNMINKVDFFALDSLHKSLRKDVPYHRITIKMGAQEKSVMYKRDTYGDVLELERWLEQFIEESDWKVDG